MSVLRTYPDQDMQTILLGSDMMDSTTTEEVEDSPEE